MIPYKRYSRCHALFVVCCGLLLSGTAQSESYNLSQTVEVNTGAFLEDRGRAGSLVGTILAGAAVAHPFAPVVGSVLGFFIGKNTEYSEGSGQAGLTRAQQAYANRSFVPVQGEQIASLGLASTFTADPQMPLAQQQMAAACSNLPRHEGLPDYCYYFAQ